MLSPLKVVLGWPWDTVLNSLYCALVQIRKRPHLGGGLYKLTDSGTSGQEMGLFIEN